MWGRIFQSRRVGIKQRVSFSTLPKPYSTSFSFLFTFSHVNYNIPQISYKNYPIYPIYPNRRFYCTIKNNAKELFSFPYKNSKFESKLNSEIYEILTKKAEKYLKLKNQLENEDNEMSIDERKKLLKIVSNVGTYYSQYENYTAKLKELFEVHQILSNYENTSNSAKEEEKEEREHFESLEGEIAEQLSELENNFLHLILTSQFDFSSLISSSDKSSEKSEKFSEANRNAILEIRCGAGGGESSLFVNDILQMYQNYADLKGWKFDILSQSSTEYGGIREVSISVSAYGEGVFERLKYESGVHRVQRIPETEALGRIHTSTITVAVLPEAKEHGDIDLRPSDIRVDVYRASGAGGQHVNTTESAVRITHLRTGIVVAIQDERSQHSNRDKAMRIMKSRLLDLERQKEEAKRSRMRMQQVGTGMRNERIRTYNFPQSRITDHRCNHSEFDMDRMLNGELLDNFVDKLTEQTDQENLELFFNDPDQYISF